MQTTSDETSATGSNGNASRHCCRFNVGQSRWTPMNIGAMVLSFIVFWPVGLVVLFWILSGRHVKDLPGAVRDAWHRLTPDWDFEMNNPFSSNSTDNVIFNEYQKTQTDRIREIQREINERSRRFNAFREEARRRADQEEFDRFMASAPVEGHQ